MLGWGGFVLVALEGNRAVITALGVLPARRRLGAGAKLIGAAVKECRRRGCSHVTCETRAGNLAPQNLLIEAGFRVVGLWARYYADDEAAVAFELRLRRPRPTGPA
ncbi:MAG: hypothetical protein BroJett014_02860 [Planctomycetota bacterium]|nr:MAG: hypothetical protein BroJett014_02860 [Planctomycetota bacterium]